MRKLVISCSVLIIFSLFREYSSTSLKLPQGIIRGTHRFSYKGKKYSAFEGIPYAEPPVGELRFKEPIPSKNWTEINVVKPTQCSQIYNGNFIGSEDCLHLNIYVARDEINVNDNIDVVIHIHGGAFQKGSTLTDLLPDYLMDKELIVAGMNYRVGVLGFLSTNDEIIPGNNGLKDQVLAMKWIKENIKYFGGNPNSITLTGLSMGGVSVHFHLLSPQSAGLFNRAYSISGTAFNARSLDKESLHKAKQIAEKHNCPSFESSEILKCLRKIPADQLTNNSIQFRPTIEYNDDPFLPDHPYKLTKDKRVNDVPWISTNTADEAFFLLDNIYREEAALKVYNDWISKGSKLLELNTTVNQKDLVNVLNKLKHKYFGENVSSEDDAIDKLNMLMSDRHWFSGSDLLLRSHVNAVKSPLYSYIFDFLPEDYLQCGGKPTAVSHCTDSKLMFKQINDPGKLKPNEEKMMELLTEFLEKFAKSGVPEIGGAKWLPVDPTEKSFNILSIKSPENIEMIKTTELIDKKFWDSLPIMENDKLYQNNC